MERLALSHPEISFQFINNNQNRLHTSGNANLKDIIYADLRKRDHGKSAWRSMQRQPLECWTGFIGKASHFQRKPELMKIILSMADISRVDIISKAIEEAYKNFMMQHKYPFTVLHFQLDGELLDVNVHPTKMELRFSDQEGMYRLVYETVRNALTGREMIPDVRVGKEAAAKQEMPKKESFPEPFEVKRRESMKKETPSSSPSMLRERSGYSSSREEGGFAKSLYEVPEKLLKPAERKVDEQAEMKKWAAEGKNPALKLQAKPALTAPVSENTVPAAASSAAAEASALSTAPASSAEAAVLAAATSSKETEAAHAPTASSTETETMPAEPPKQMDLFEEKLLSKEHIKEHRIIGQLFDTYWLVEFHEKLYIIDQHAAHEKVLFERTMKSLKDKEYTAQQISPPLIVSLSMKEQELLNKYSKNFEAIGFEIEPFGGDEFSIRAVPGNLFGLAEKEVFLEMLDSLDKDTGRVSEDMINEKIASMSCKAAVKGNHRMSEKEAEALIDELLTLENPYNCPHGRPTIIAMSKYELEKKFKRIV